MLSRGHPLQLALGLIVWALWFVLLYGGQGLACSLAPPAPEQGAMTWINLALLVFTVLVVIVLLYAARRCQSGAATAESSMRRFITALGAAVYLAAAIATLFVGLPLIALPPCL